MPEPAPVTLHLNMDELLAHVREEAKNRRGRARAERDRALTNDRFATALERALWLPSLSLAQAMVLTRAATGLLVTRPEIDELEAAFPVTAAPEVGV